LQNGALAFFAEQLEIGKDTVRKAINDGHLIVAQKQAFNAGQATAKSSCNAADALAAYGMGTTCSRVLDGVFASLGEKDGAETRFEPCLDFPKTGSLTLGLDYFQLYLIVF
jgi:hypothetical protein